MKPIDYAILILLVVLVALPVRYAWQHRGTCGGCQGCAGCSRRDCQQKKEDEQ